MAAEYYGEEIGYVYLMEFKFKAGDSYKTLYKVGITKNKPVDRMLQIVNDFFSSRRYIPECRLVRYRKIAKYKDMEKHLHSLLSEYSYTFKRPFSGSSEFFNICIDTIDKVYCEEVPLKKD